jgi:peptide/nickel transport system permease protein
MLSGDILRNFAVAPWIGIFPGFALTAVVFGINVYGDALRDILDPKLRGR